MLWKDTEFGMAGEFHFELNGTISSIHQNFIQRTSFLHNGLNNAGVGEMSCQN